MSKGSSPRDPNKTGRVTPELPKNHVILFTGNYGSGKTEVAVNYASWLAREGKRVQIADLDLVNPYFRVREAREPLEKLGIEVVAPAGDYHSADLPILLPQVKGLIEHPKGYTILDVGGDNVGATVLSALTNAFAVTGYDMIFVVNRNRPFTDTVEGVLRLVSEVETASRLKITSIVGNTHLMDETTVDTVQSGIELTESVAKKLGLPVRFITIEKSLLDTQDLMTAKHPVLPLERLLHVPWKQQQNISTTHSRDGFGKLTSQSQ